jgi:hypothetical protein
MSRTSLIVGRFSADYQWPVLGDYRGYAAEYFGLISDVDHVRGLISVIFTPIFLFYTVKGVLGFPVYIVRGMSERNPIETEKNGEPNS